jgi:type VI secretion system protein ImpM
VIAAPAAVLDTAAFGFCGKLPARGDFVSARLPRRFVDPWHDWLQHMLAGSRDLLGDAWLPAWLEAPIWNFALAPGLCGTDAMIGLWLPSVDRIGRYFPLTIAAPIPEAAPWPGDAAMLASAATAGLDALSDELAPDVLGERLCTIAPDDGGIAIPPCPAVGSRWWTDGSPRVPATAFDCDGLPDATRFAAMLDARNPRLPETGGGLPP